MYNYHRQISNYCSRRKWIFLIALISCVVCIVLLTRHPSIENNTTVRDTYLDDVPADLYQTVLHTWYNFSNGEKWYNKKNISALSPEAFHDLLTDIQQNWMIWNHDPDEPYELQEPDVEDPSMGQSTVIREIFNDKKNGFFIECGAYDGEMRSNTLFLERFNGWSGLLIEADPINFTKMLQKNRKAYLSPTGDFETTVAKPEHQLSVWRSIKLTLSRTWKSLTSLSKLQATFLMARNIGRLHEPENTTENAPAENTLDVAYTGEHIRVQCLPLTLYIAALGVETVDYFSLDIEGNEIDVLETIPFNEVDIKALSVEYIHNAKGRKYLIDMMDHRGYYVYSFVEHPDNLANDIIFVKRNT
ncbi:Protein Star [Temnothorax longispinosus]|uniref:Protein Star n=1 Tax=Temnothorax longispinosus TaxID=300112 RepID=A0A4S2KTM4_9HYME|nr:Protein Star [Temnothorax longispinosus]